VRAVVTEEVSLDVPEASSPYVVIAAYKFVRLPPMAELPTLRQHLRDLCAGTSLKGTILLSPEGINLFLSGIAVEVERFLASVRALPGLADLEAKVSRSPVPPFKRMLIKIKSQIIAFNDTSIDPSQRTARKLSATTLKQWLDEGRPVTLLDTRNDYEVQMGTFAGALDPGIATFREFPRAVEQLPQTLKTEPLVIFCTGGIRCEKAGPYLEQQGFTDVYQLEGGILRYFEECRDAHFVGDCYVFDERVTVDASLSPGTSPILAPIADTVR